MYAQNFYEGLNSKLYFKGSYDNIVKTIYYSMTNLPKIVFHQGNTDSDRGHKDYLNRSGFGLYHYHHGIGAHLHPNGICSFESSTSSLIDLLKSYDAVLFTTTKGGTGSNTYVFEGIIPLEGNKKQFTLEIYGYGTDSAFYLVSEGQKVFKESFWGTELKPLYVDRLNSPWNNDSGGLDYLVNADYFKSIIKKYCDLDAPREVIILGHQVLSEKGVDFLGRLETEGSIYNVYDDKNNLVGIISADIGDGGITYGFGHHVPYANKEKQIHLQEVYGLEFKIGIFVPIDLCIRIKNDDVNYNKIDNIIVLDRFIENNNILLTQYQYDALVCMAFLRRIPDNLKNLIIEKDIENSLYADYQEEFFNIALDDFKSLASFEIYGIGWTRRLRNETELYFHNDYTKKY